MMKAEDHRQINPNWFNVPFVTEVRPPSGVFCSDCGQDVNLYSEGETYDYSENIETGEIEYMCEDCLEKFKQEIGYPQEEDIDEE